MTELNESFLPDVKDLLQLTDDLLGELQTHFSVLPGEVDTLIDYMANFKTKYNLHRPIAFLPEDFGPDA